jgi:hypothetical protein
MPEFVGSSAVHAPVSGKLEGTGQRANSMHSCCIQAQWIRAACVHSDRRGQVSAVSGSSSLSSSIASVVPVLWLHS